MPSQPAPAQLRQRIDHALDRVDSAARAQRPSSEPIRRKWNPFWTGALGGVGASAVTALIILFLVPPSSRDVLLHDLTADQMRSLMPAHLIDVVSTDQHTVKPWFAGHTGVSPVAADFVQAGYQLIGGRADYLVGRRSAVVVYRHGRHVINVFAWLGSKGSLPSDTTQSGYHMSFWRSGDLDYCAVSDTSWEGGACAQAISSGRTARGG